MIYNIGLVWEHIISSVNYSDATPGLADEAQTRNFGLGRTTLYQLSYCQIISKTVWISIPKMLEKIKLLCRSFIGF